MRHVARPGVCKQCFRPFLWFFTSSGAAVPFDEDGTPHRDTCGSAADAVAQVGGNEEEGGELLDSLPC